MLCDKCRRELARKEDYSVVRAVRMEGKRYKGFPIMTNFGTPLMDEKAVRTYIFCTSCMEDVLDILEQSVTGRSME